MPQTRSGGKRSCGTPGRSNVVKMKKTLEPCPGQSREDCTDPKETETSCQNGVSTDSKKLADLSEKKESMSRTIQTKLQNVQRLKASIVEARKTRTRIQSEIRYASHTIISQFRQKEKELMDTLDGVSEKQFGLLSDDVNQNKTDIQLANQKMVVLKKMLGDNMMELHPAHENLLSGPREDEDQVVRLIHDVFVSQDTENVKKGIEDLSFGQLDRTFQDLYDRSSRPKLLNTTTVALKNEFRQTCYIFDIIVLDVKGITTIVVSDIYNTSVKSFYVRNDKCCHSVYRMVVPRKCCNATPHDLTLLEQNQVMVSVPDSFRILILAVTPDLICLSVINTSCRYEGLRVLTPSTLVGCESHSGAIDILVGVICQLTDTYLTVNWQTLN